jgi:hypothetical protein
MSVIEGHGNPEFTMSFGRRGERKLISYEEMQSYSLDERYELSKKYILILFGVMRMILQKL